MIVTVTGYKGGIGKTTTALHLAAYLQRQAPAVLVDGDLNRSATGWGRNGSLPFRVVDERQAAKVSREFEHIVIDTAARPVREDLEALVAGCDHLIIPTTPDALALDALVQTVGALEALGATKLSRVADHRTASPVTGWRRGTCQLGCPARTGIHYSDPALGRVRQGRTRRHCSF